jgi:anti-sigma factor RsiW
MATKLECRWVRPRLALLAGDAEGRDLRWDDRRHVERHLIGCPSCRTERESLATAVAALHETAAVPMKADAPSIWPALERQIRASRHARPNPWASLGFGPSLGLAAGLLVVGTAIGLVGGRIQTPSAPHPRPAVQTVATPAAPRPALPEGPAPAQVAAVTPAVPKPEVRLDLDPKAAANRDPQRAVGQ